MAAEALAARDKIGVQDFVLLEDFRSLDAFGENLKKRFNEKLIYTYIGPVLVSVNPYRDLKLYTTELCSEYRAVEFFKLPPHVFAIADTAYFAMRSDRRDQCILVSGESGAGKTEATKQILKYLAVVSENSREVGKIKDQLLQSNPLLEAFGNATTTRNDNSSRFGKYMDVQFDFHGAPVGGHILNYLLEKSRVVQQSLGERNFHIFYQVLDSGDAALLQRLSLTGKVDDYRYVASERSETVFTIKDKEQYKETMDALRVLAFSTKHIEEIFNIVGAILHLGNVDLSGSESGVVIDNADKAELVGKLLGSSGAQFKSAMLNKTILVSGDKVASPLNLEEAVYSRDAMSKAIYERLFSWLVCHVNRTLEVKRSDTAVIGLLDIYGFEVFQVNGFEQFCINYCNEKLQQIFIELTLKLEQEEYSKEGIEWEQIDYFNNKIILDLIEDKSKGIVSFLDEECTRPGTVTDASFLDKMVSGIGAHDHFVCFELADREAKKTIERDEFRLVHYAGDVTYNVKGFIEKNNDLLFRDIKEAMQSSSNSILCEIFPKAEVLDKKRPLTAGTQFKNSLNKLADILKSKVPSYVRCVKPNNKKSPVIFDDELVHHQVKYLGLMENLRVRRAGFAYRRDYNYFYQRYKCLCTETWPSYKAGTPAQACQIIADKMGWNSTDFKVGKTKVFIRNPKQLYEIEDKLAHRKVELATLLQAQTRKVLARKHFMRVRAAVTIFSKNWKRLVARRLRQRRRNAADEIIKFIKGFIMRNQPPNEFNKQFVRIVRHQWLVHCLKPALPKDVLDKSWPECPLVCQEASAQLRALHQRKLVRHYVRSLTAERKQQLTWKLTCRDTFKDKKSVYSSTVPTPFSQSRIEDALTQRVHDVVGKTATDGPSDIVYATHVVKYDRHGYKPRPRILAATASSVLLMDPKNMAVKEQHSPSNIKSLTVTSLSDGFVMIGFNALGKGDKGDLLLSSEHVIELATLLASSSCNNMDVVTFASDEFNHSLPANKQGTVRVKSGAPVSILKEGNALVVTGE
ncbi:unconventional myosin-Ic-like isoform X2 [Sycon ciliatum]|uniref:unconventional myosin-Ic-like isoform X2 n=1 Tax=Sycon ciliatum TaxID=27933 RepID=UPI0031F6F0BF